MERIIRKLSPIGVPSLVLIVAMESLGYTATSIIAKSLAVFVPAWVPEKISSNLLNALSDAIVKYGADAIFSATMKALYRHGENKRTILQKIYHYPIPNSLKRKIRGKVHKL